MTIQSADFKHYKTLNNLGGPITATLLSSGVLHNLFDAFTSQEAADGAVEFACVYLENGNATDTMTTLKQWIQANTPSGTTAIRIGLGASGVNGVETAIGNKNTPPNGVVFSSAANEAAAVNFPNLAPGDHHAYWVEWTLGAGTAAIALDNAVIRTKSDTPV